MRPKRLFRSSLLLALALLVPLLSLPLAHASTFVGFGASQADAASCSGTLCVPTTNDNAATNGFGEVVISPFAGTVISAAVETGSGPPNQIVILTFAGTPGITAYGVGPCTGTCYFVNNGQSFTVQDVESVTGCAANSFCTVALANPPTVTNGQYVGIIWMQTGGSSQYTMGACGGTSGGCGSFGNSVAALAFNFATSSPIIGNAYTNTGTNGPTFVENPVTTGATFQPSGTGGSTINITQCYGNCGTPPITLANTNSTHTVNFNQTITLFYEFQSNVNGFLLNVTTSMAKSYTTLPNGPAFGVYVIQSCPIGQSPFSPECPGLLQAQSAGQNTFSPPKGKISFSGLRIAVANGQWIGIALSGFQSGLDVNDTNTNVNLFQTNEGKMPSSIQAPASLGNSKVGLWAWVNGNVVSGSPPTSSSSGACGPGLDFILACAVNSLCSVVTVQCQTGSSIFLIVILTIFSIAVTLGIFSYWLPGMNITTKGMGEFAILIFIGWFVAFSAYGLLLPYMIIFMFFVIAWLFLGRSKGTGPI